MPANIPTVRDLILVLEAYFLPDLSIYHALYLLRTISSFSTLLRLHQNQIREPNQPLNTAWRKITHPLLTAAFDTVNEDIPVARDEHHRNHITALHNDIEQIVDFLGLGRPEEDGDSSAFDRLPKLILVTSRLNCMFCPDDANRRSLRLDKRKVSNVHVLGENLQFVQGSLIIAECPQCNSIYYPDKITYKDPVQRGRNKRRQRLEGDATYLCISKSGIWAHRRVALMQEKAVHRFTAGWSNFAYFLSDLNNRKVTKHQAKKLFVEHFARRLLVAHGKLTAFFCCAHPSIQELISAVVIMIGQNGGILPNALTHGCQDCTHEKRTREDLTREGVILAQGPDAIEQVVGVPYAGGANGAPQNGNVRYRTVSCFLQRIELTDM